MFAGSPPPTRHRVLPTLAAAAVCGLVLFAGSLGPVLTRAEAQGRAGPPAVKPAAKLEGQAVPSAREVLGPAAFVPIAEQPPAKIIIDPPLPDQLAKGVVVIQFRTENLRLSPVFGRAALAVSPRIGHLHVTLDDGPWLWGHFSDQELIVAGLPPGPHKIRIELVNANHETLDESVVKFEVPRRALMPAEPKAGDKPLAAEPAAKIILDSPEPDLLAKGVALIRYRTEKLQIAPVFGPAALAVSPRIGHLRVTVNDAAWHWVDASGHAVDAGNLPPGPHKIRIELVNANHQVLAESVVKFEVPRQSPTRPDSGVGSKAGTRASANQAPKAPQTENPVTQATAIGPNQGRAAEKYAIRPFRVNVPDADLADLRKRIQGSKWPDRETVPDASQGVQLATVQKLARYWATEYDWRKVEAKLNNLPQFMTEIDGLDIHFIHVRSKHEDALPLIVTHGWPGSIIEQLKIIDPLTNPTAHGGKASDAFHVVIPSLPGYGFSAKPTAPGWTPDRIARAWATLMQRLGYKRYVAQGGDWGNAVSELMALQEPSGLLGIHTNMAATVPANISKALAFNEAPPADLTAEERNAWNQLDHFYKKGLGYAIEMNNRAQTLYGIADSPVGLAAWMLDHDIRSYELIARVFDGKKEGLTRDDILDNVTLYWVTNTAISSARLYWDTAQVSKGGFFDVRGVKIPVAVSAFPDEIYAAPRSWAEKAYPKLIHFNKLDKGGHFAAWEQPELFTQELRAAFRSLRGSR